MCTLFRIFSQTLSEKPCKDPFSINFEDFGVPKASKNEPHFVVGLENGFWP